MNTCYDIILIEMNTQDRATILTQFINRLDQSTINREPSRLDEQIGQLQLNENNLPRLDVVDQLMDYHRDITGTIEKTYREVKDVMIQMKQLKNRKKNVQTIMDSITAIVEIKRLSYGLGADPKEINTNIETYYSIKSKVYHMDKFIDKIEKQISEIEKEYQTIFDAQMAKNNSNNITQVSKVLQLIRSNTNQSNKPDTLQQITNFCVGSANKEFKQIQQALFAIPIVGNSESNYMFFDMAKTAMKVIAILSNSCKNNVLKVSGEEGLIHILKTLFELVAGGIIFQLLMRLKKYYEIDKIVIKKEKFALKEKQVKQLQPYIKEYTAIWNQLQRLKIHLLAQVNDSHPSKAELKLTLQNTLNNTQLVQLNSNIITFMQAFMRYRFDKLLKTSRFVSCLCSLDYDFFREINKTNITHNNHVQDFLEQTITRISQGLQKGLETLNMLIISAIINFTNHNLIYEDVFYAFNELFTRSFNKLPSSDPKVHNALLLTLNAIAAFPKAMKMLLHIKLPEEVSETRIKVQIEEVINNNERRTYTVLEGLIAKIVGAEWFRFELSRDYEKNIERWLGLQTECFHMFVQGLCRAHAEIILETQFSKKYTQTSAINFDKEVRSIISFYQGYSHQILPNFKTILDYLQVLQLQGDQDFKDIVKRFANQYPESELKRIWILRN